MSNNNGNCCSSDYMSLRGLGTNTFRVLLPQVYLWLFLFQCSIKSSYHINHIRNYTKIQQNSFDIPYLLKKVNFLKYSRFKQKTLLDALYPM